jgi:hypothetical protein
VPRTASVHVRVGDRVVGGLTIMAVIS